MIYKNGYYLDADPDLPFIISEQLPGYTEEYIKAVIDSCLELELFDKRIYSEENAISSEGIQLRYREISISMKRKGVIDVHNLLNPSFSPSEEKAISSEENRISSEENNISSEEKAISSENLENMSELSPQIKRKENKIKEINKEKGIKKNNSTGGVKTDPLLEVRQEMAMNEEWRSQVIMNRHLAGQKGYDFGQFMNDLSEFFRIQKEQMVDRLELRQAAQHFSNWLNAKYRGAYGTVSKQAKKTDGARPGTKIDGEGTVSPPTIVPLF
jgi:hypothetical protein